LLRKRPDSAIFIQTAEEPGRMTIDRRARVLSIEKWDDYVLLRLACPSVGRTARPGQFVMVKVSAEPFPLLRRPLSLHAADASGISLFFKVCGLGTEILSRKRDGDVLDVLGPLGKGFSVSEALRGKRVVLVGGGRGAAPLFFLGGEVIRDFAMAMTIGILVGTDRKYGRYRVENEPP